MRLRLSSAKLLTGGRTGTELGKNGKEKDILIESQTLRKLNSSDNFGDVLEIKEYSKQSCRFWNVNLYTHIKLISFSVYFVCGCLLYGGPSTQL